MTDVSTTSGPGPGEGVAGVLLAAGGGRRMGMAKALVELDGETLATRGARTLAAGGCDLVVVVLGASAHDVRARSALAGTRVVVNSRWAEGASTSVRVGLAQAQHDGANAAVLLPVDMPLVTPATVSRLVEAWRRGAPAAVAASGGGSRPPVVVDRALWGGIAESLAGDVGARSYLRAHPELVTLVECGDPGELTDVDTPDDLERARAVLALHHPRP